MPAVRTAERRLQLPLVVTAIAKGLLIGLVGANVWSVALATLGFPLAMLAETAFLALYIWWASGGGAPSSRRASRRSAFRTRSLSRTQWCWGIAAALSFAICVHASLVILFRLVPFPVDAFRSGHDFAAGTSLTFRWLAIVFSALSAGICEETGFRGYMQHPIEKRHGAMIAIFISSMLFMLVHLNQAWAIPQILPIIFSAGVLLGSMAWASGSLLPGMLAHTLMDIGLFAYWWTKTLGTFSGRPIWITGIDFPAVATLALVSGALALTLYTMVKMRGLREDQASTARLSLPGSDASASR